jgi:ATP-dependent RNA helicase RhlE
VPEDYVHRVGRTARASASGKASSFAAPDELGLLRDIERYVRKPIARAEVPRQSEAFQAELKRASERAPHPDAGGQRPQGGGGHGQQRRGGGGGRHGGNRRGGGGGGQRGHGGHGGSTSSGASGTGHAPSGGHKPVSVFRGGPKRRR